MPNYSPEHALLETLYPFTATNHMTGNDLMNAARELLPADDLRTWRLFEALDLLCKEGLISGDPHHLDTSFFITAKGVQRLRLEQEEETLRKEQHRHDTKITILGAVLGAVFGNIDRIITSISDLIIWLSMRL